jgi:EAL domain-containing protein (putative c-di-GMP-specific phosphodiesterase class I)
MFLRLTDKVADVFDKLKAQGVQISIDDFGTGYSSLSYLKKLPIDSLKIDRSFVRDIPEDRDDVEIASTIITMARGLGLGVVAEGIETREQLEFLKALGCDRGQGYFLVRPQPAEQISSWLQSHTGVVTTEKITP